MQTQKKQQITYKQNKISKERLEPNNQLFDINSIQMLQQKYQQQKLILKLQNKKLEEKLYAEMAQNQTLKMHNEKVQQKHKNQTRQLYNQIQIFKAKCQLTTQRQVEPDEEQEQIRNQLLNFKQLMQEKIKLDDQVEQMREIIYTADEDNKCLIQQNQNIKKNIETCLEQIQDFKSKQQKFYQIKKQFAKQREQIQKQFQKSAQKIASMEEELTKNKVKCVQQKRRRKELEAKLKQLQEKTKRAQREQMKSLENDRNRKEKQLEDQKYKNIQLVGKIHFCQIAIQKKEQTLKSSQEQLKELIKDNQNYSQKTEKLQRQFNKVNNQNRKLLSQIKQIEQRHSEDIQDQKRNHQNQMTRLKKQLVLQIHTILKDKNEQRSKKNLQLLMKNCKSSGNFIKFPLIDNTNSQLSKQGPNQNNNIFDKYKLQTQINSLQGDNINLKKQVEQLQSELLRHKENSNDLKQDCERKTRDIQQLKLKLQKAESSKHQEIVQMRKQISNLKGKQTQNLELMRDRAEYEEAMNLKISFYDKKIKDLLQNIQRKDQIIQKLKINRADLQDKLKFFQDKLANLLSQNQSMKRIKTDNNRKEQLIKDYKSKIQKGKQQIEQLKLDIESAKRDKIRAQKNMQSKEDYVATLKKKHAKEIQQLQQKIEEKFKKTQTKVNKEVKLSFEQKVKKLKRQNQNLFQNMILLKDIVLSKVQQKLALSIPISKKKKNNPQYEGAKLLGLNSSQIEDFLNPTLAIDKGIVNQLQQYWQNSDYQLFFEQSVIYLQGKVQYQNILI